MRTFVITATIIGLLGAAGTAFAQQKTETKFYDFDEHVVDGEFQAPEGEHVRKRGEIEFDPLYEAGKKDFVEQHYGEDE